MKPAFRILMLLSALSIAALAPAASHPIYNENANAAKQVAAAMKAASTSGKNVVLIFGANWCPDCHALDAAMHRGRLAKLIQDDYVVVHIDVGRFDKNLDLGNKYGVPIKKGIPAIAVLDPFGFVLCAQSHGEFANAAQLPSLDFEAFFEKWKPSK